MILPNSMLFRFVDWIADHLGLDLKLGEDRILDPLDEHEIVEQLQYGRDLFNPLDRGKPCNISTWCSCSAGAERAFRA